MSIIVNDPTLQSIVDDIVGQRDQAMLEKAQLKVRVVQLEGDKGRLQLELDQLKASIIHPEDTSHIIDVSPVKTEETVQ